MFNEINHHAYLIIGEREAIREKLDRSLKKVEPLATLVWHRHETFGVDESRGLIEQSSRRNWSGAREFVVIEADRYTPEAQNALLKLFEEPRTGLHFFLISNQLINLLPTLQSRMLIIEPEIDFAPENNLKLASQFLKATPAERLDLIAKEIKKETTRAEWLLFLNNLETICHKTLPLTHQVFNELMMVRNYITDPASAPKLLLEHLAFVLPSVVKL